MIVANRATLSGIIATPFLSFAGQGFSGGIDNNIRRDPSPTPLGFGRMRYRTLTRDVSPRRPAHAGTHTPQLIGWAMGSATFYNNQRRWLWVPACAGTTSEVSIKSMKMMDRPVAAADAEATGRSNRS